MGVDINTYRSRVGLFVSSRGAGMMMMPFVVDFSHEIKLIGAVSFIRILLIIACIEQNPGPADQFIYRYQYLLIEIGTEVLRKVFDNLVNNDFMQYLKAKSNQSSRFDVLMYKGIITDAQKKFLPPLDKKPSSSNFDIILLVCLLRNVCGLRSWMDTVWTNPSPTDFSLEADIAKLRECGNYLAHIGTVYISEAELKTKWNELSTILKRLNPAGGIKNLSSLIDDAEHKYVDKELKETIDVVIKPWAEMDLVFNKRIESLEHGMFERKPRQSVIKAGQSVIKDGQLKAELNERQQNIPNRIENQIQHKYKHSTSNVETDLMKQSPSEISIGPPEDPKCFEDQNEDKGRLKKMDKYDIECLLRFCPKEVGSGGFGQVYKSKGKISGLDIDVVLKKILVKDDEDEKMESVTNEKLASRTLHFAIVPLLAYGADNTTQGSERAFYFITPYLENGNLSDAIQTSNASGSPVLTLTLRMKIMYHIASAVHFLHNPVPKFRGAILHLDITSLNIVLDLWFNARLIDFGLAREMEEGRNSAKTTKVQIPYSMGYCKTIRDGQFGVYADYYNIGVVIRELLTGIKPYDGNEQLKELNKREIKERLMHLWIDSEARKPFPVARTLINLSEQCLDEKDINSKEILNTVQELMTEKLHKYWGFSGVKCEMCMRYDAVDDTILEHKKECEMRVCASCMRHSYCNPIVCHTCGEVIIPNIGYGWDAVLIAGNDLEDTDLAKVFSDDVENVKKVITSKCPLVMGISENRVLIVKPKSPGESDPMKPSLTDQLDTFLSVDPDGKHTTLVLYVSGHNSKENGFQLGKEDECFIHIEKILNHLQGTDENTAGRYERLVIFLDCCYAPKVKVENHGDVILVQLNACTQYSKAKADKTGSIFQCLFTQALTGRALSSKCMNKCDNCSIDNVFLTVINLQEYIDTHYSKSKYASELCSPVVNLQNAQQRDIRIGYVVNVLVNLEFHFELKDEEEKRNFPHSMFSNIKELRNVLLDEYLEMIPTRQGPPFSRTYFHDMLFIFSKLGPKPKHRQEMDTIEKVNMAWECRRQLYVSLREASKKTGTDIVGVFFEKTSVKPVVDYLFINGTKTVVDENTVEFTTRFKEFRNFLKSQKPTLDKVLNVVNVLKDAKDELEKKQKVDVFNLSVKFPYNETTSPKYRTDFLCFCLKDDKIKG